MDVELLTTGAARWVEFLERTRHDFYHLPAYVAFCAGTEGATACAAYATDGDSSLLLPLVLRPVNSSTPGRGYRDALSPYGYPGPLLRGDGAASVRSDFVARSMGAIVERLRTDDIVSLFVRSHPILSPPLDVPSATVVAHGRTVSIDLTRTSDEMWHQTAKGHRTEIARAERDGHRAYFDDTFERLPLFAAMYRDTMARRQAAAEYHFSDAYFDGLRQALGARLRLCLVEIGGDIAAGGLFAFTGDLVEYHLSATDARFERQRPTKLMLHFVRTWAAANGGARFHLGGGVGGQEDSLFAFKAGFAPDRHWFQTLRAVCHQEAYAELVQRTGAGIDPTNLTGFFPAYRRR